MTAQAGLNITTYFCLDTRAGTPSRVSDSWLGAAFSEMRAFDAQPIVGKTSISRGTNLNPSSTPPAIDQAVFHTITRQARVCFFPSQLPGIRGLASEAKLLLEERRVVALGQCSWA